MKLNLRIVIFLLLCSTYAGTAEAQGVVITPLQRAYAPAFQRIDLFSLGITDTLDLPFFEDFVTGVGFPSSLRWTDHQSHINTGFAIRPPSYGVATFDHLNSKGKPWHPIDKNLPVYADSLTSQPINLLNYFDGVNTKNYTAADSIYLSFFYQAQGLGDKPEPGDSLLLFFKNAQGEWNQVWHTVQIHQATFKQVVVPILNASFFHSAFQFRFVNYAKALGNLNHWHIDYLRIDRQRNLFDTLISDVAFIGTRKGFLNNLSTMPYNHFKVAPSSNLLSTHYVVARNLDPTGILGVQTRFGIEVRNRYNSLVYQIPFGPISKNILPGQDSAIDFQALQFDTLSGDHPWLDITYKLDPQSPDNTPNQYNAPGNNNRLTIRQAFHPWYAYDDGSAEGGFGLDYSYLGNVKGQMAMRFYNEKQDTLKGLAIYFNISESDVSSRPFYLRVWKEISLPVGSPDNNDQLYYETYVSGPVYTDSINHFSYFFFDSSLVLPPGPFYVGWRQNAPFILNVGYDNNFRFEDRNTRNPFIYYNLLGTWESMPPEVMGAPMIRPLIGSGKDFPMNRAKKELLKWSMYPNPTDQTLHFRSEKQIVEASIYNTLGQHITTQSAINGFVDVSHLKAGMYRVKVVTKEGLKSSGICIISR